MFILRSVVLLLFVCWAGVSANGVSIHLEDEQMEPVPEACREEVKPLLNALYTSLHDQRNKVHVQCRNRLQTEQEHHRQEKANLMRSHQHCKQVARSLPDKAAAELIKQCDDTVNHLIQDHAYVQAITHVYKTCQQLAMKISVRMRDNTMRLMQVLPNCSRQHTCSIYNLVNRSILTNVDQIHSGVSGDMQNICHRPGLTHNIHRSCRRFILTSGILVDPETFLPRLLHQNLSTFCAKYFTPLQKEVPTEAQPTSELIATTKPTVFEATTAGKVVMTSESAIVEETPWQATKETQAIEEMTAQNVALTTESVTVEDITLQTIKETQAIEAIGPEVSKHCAPTSAQDNYVHDAMFNLAVVTSRAKPAAHIVGDGHTSYHISERGALSIWRAEFTNGGMKLVRGTELVVPAAGPYWCYAQINFKTGHSVLKGHDLPTVQPPSNHQVNAQFYLFVNEKKRMASSAQPAVEASAYTGGLVNLNIGDRLSVHVYTPNVYIQKDEYRTFFGCYLI